MVDRADRVAAACRHRASVLVCAGGDGGYALPTASIGDGPAEAAVASLLGRLGLDGATVERRGEPVDAGLVPFLVAVGERSLPSTDACRSPAWEPPTALLEAGEDPWWRAYRAVSPTVETVAADTERGSTALATDALWALRDVAAEAGAAGDGLGSVDETARRLLDARPSMAALANRVNRAMAGAAAPTDVVEAATAGIRRVDAADGAAAQLAAETVDGGLVLTLSRSGTVRRALLAATAAVDVLVSRPGGEGLAVAEALREAGLTVESVPDAAVYDRLRSGAVDAVLVGADAVTPDGGVVNKVGTRAAALAAEVAGVPCYAVCAADKVQPAGRDLVLEPRFDWTPPRLVTAVLTERGRLDADAIAAVAEVHRELADWGDAR